jgi:hypothetical protein
MQFASLNNGDETLHPPDFRKKKRPRYFLTSKEMARAFFVATMMLLTEKTKGMIIIYRNFKIGATPTVYSTLTGISYPEQAISAGGLNKISMAGGA